jgi:hypothetical protein
MKRWSVPKPVLFAICGTLGGLAAAIVLGLPVSLVLAPTPQQLEAKIRIAQPESMAVYLGDKNRFKVRLALDHWHGDVVLTVQPTVTGVKAESVTVHEPDTEAQIEVTVAPTVAEGSHSLRIVATGAGAKPPTPAEGVLQLKVLRQPPSLRIAVANPVKIDQGGKNRFTVKIARGNFEGDVKVRFDNTPQGVTLPTAIIPADSTQMEIEARASADAPIGSRAVTASAESVDYGKITPARAPCTLEVLHRPIPKVDILFVLDLTGSMGFAIDGIKTGIRDFVEKLELQSIDAQIGLIGFGDIEEDGPRGEPFALKFGDGETLTRDYKAFGEKVSKLKADRGGYTKEESSLQGLTFAAQQPFRPNAARVLILVTDAGPRIHKKGDKYFEGLERRPYSIAETIDDLKKDKIAQLHMVVTPDDYNGNGRTGSPISPYKLFHAAFKGSYFNIYQGKAKAPFAQVLPKLSEEIASLTIATLPSGALAPETPAPPPVESAAALPPPPEVPGLKAVQSTQTYAEADKYRLLLAVAMWTAIVAGGISLLIVFGQQLYLRRGRPRFAAAATALAGGLLAGLIGGAAGQIFVQTSTGGDALSKLIGWGILGGLIGIGMSFFVPNLRWHRGLLGGLLGGIFGALAFLLIAVLLGLLIGLALDASLGRYVGDALGQLAGAAVLGFWIGLMVALAELAFRSRWLEITYGTREVRTVTLGSAAVTIGGDDKRAAVVVQGAAPLAFRYRVDKNRVLCEDVAAGSTSEVRPGHRQQLGSVSIAVCSSATVRGSGYTLRLADGKSIPLGVGMPLTPDALPGLEPQGTDRTVALVSARPNDPNALLLRNRSKQTWKARDSQGQSSTIEPGRGVELAAGMRIDFGPVRGTLLKSN